jgi:hypothetical protein
MKFLKTDESMSFVDEDLYSEYVIEIKDEMLDLSVPDFIHTISQKIKKYNYCKDSPVLFVVKCDELTEEDIEYSRTLIYEIIAESIIKERVNKDWQPKLSINSKLDMTMKAQTNLLNYNTLPNILNVKFVKNDKMLYNMIVE